MNSPVPSPKPRSTAELLAKLGLTLDVFDRAGREHLAAYFGCDPHYPRIFRAISAWAEGNHSIRQSLAPRWKAKDEYNQPLAINEDENIAITALSGDQYTGTDQIPSTRSPKGKKTAEAVEANCYQAEFAFVAEQRAAAIAEAAKVPGRQLWIFLTFRDFERGELRSELSRPKDMGDDGYIESWWERIIFPAIRFDQGSIDSGPDNPNSGNDDGGQSPDITVYIPRRSS